MVNLKNSKSQSHLTPFVKCRKFEGCSAPLCPLQKSSIEKGIWYTDEEICAARNFQSSVLIKKQKLVIKAGASSEKYFTAEMLEATRQVRKGIEGIDPDLPLEKASELEVKWVAEKGKRVVAEQVRKSGSVVAKKKTKLRKSVKRVKNKK